MDTKLFSDRVKEKGERLVLTIPNVYSGCASSNIANIEDNLNKLGGVKDVKFKRFRVHISKLLPVRGNVDNIKKAMDEMGYVIVEEG